MTRGRPLEGAPGWRVIERRQPRKRRASVTMLAVAACLLLAFAGTYRYQVGWPPDHRPKLASPAVITTHTAAAARPENPVAETPQPEGAIVVKPEPEVAAPPVSPSPVSDSLRIFIHYPAHRDDAVPAIRLAALLQTRGFPIVDIRLVEIEVEQASVRYFFPGDRADSRRLVDAIRTLLPREAPDQATDLSHFSPKPRPGTVELWLPAAGPGPMAQGSSF